jgi:hypothetical protein
MNGNEHPQKRALLDHRERVLEGLSVAFSRDELSMDEFEARVDAAFEATGANELGTLVADLGTEARQASVPLQASDVALVATNRSEVSLALPRPLPTIAVFGNVERCGRVHYAAHNRIVSVFGNVELDLRQAQLTAPVTDLNVRAVFGNVEIVVPPQLMVICDGIGVFGSFTGMHRVPLQGTESGVLLRITGKAVFGNVEVRTLPAGPFPAGLASARRHLASK